MIIRGILDDVEGCLKTFDFFNDCKDTRNWLIRIKRSDVVLKLDKANERAWSKRRNQIRANARKKLK